LLVQIDIGRWIVELVNINEINKTIFNILCQHRYLLSD